MTRVEAPVGLFDSGVGGLTVLQAVRRRFPAQPLLYVADQCHVPYGDKDPTQIRALALAITRALVRTGCKAVVMACNISSATALEDAASEHVGTPVVGVLKPAVRVAAAIAEDKRPRFGVLATRGTVETGVYPREIAAVAPAAVTVQVACPAFVPLVEQGVFDGPEVTARCVEYLKPLAEAACDRIILGCTHYPYLLPALQRAASALFDIVPAFIDPADAAVDELAERTVLPVDTGDGDAALYTTGDVRQFSEQVRLLLRTDHPAVLSAQWHHGALQLAPRCSDERAAR